MRRRVGVFVAIGLLIIGAAVWRLRFGTDKRPTAVAGFTDAGRTAATMAAGRQARRDGSVRGTVKDQSAMPIAAAIVCIASTADAASPEQPRCVVTGGDGGFVLTELVASPYALVANARTYRPARHGLRLSAGEARDGVELVLPTGGVELTGVVQDIGGGPIAHAWVRARRHGEPWGPSVETDDRGGFSMWTAAGEVELAAMADGYAHGGAMGRAPGSVDVLLTPESSVAGIVIDARTRRPVEGARVTVAASGTVVGGLVSAPTDELGAFRVTGLTPDRYVATARSEHGYGRSEVSIVVGLGQHVEGVEVELHPAVLVRGRILGPGGQPAGCSDGGTVQLRDLENVRYITLRDGLDDTKFADGVLPGTYEVVVWCEGAIPRDTYPRIVVDDRDVTDRVWEVDAGATLRGRVTTRTGAVVASARVHVTSMATATRAAERTSTGDTDASGKYEVSGLGRGAQRIAVDSPHGVAPAKGFHIDLAGRALAEQDLVLEDSGTIQGSVVDAEGRPVARMEIVASAVADGASSRDGITTDVSGAFTIEGLRPGHYMVSAQRGGQRLNKPGTTDDDRQGAHVHVRAGQPATIKLVVATPAGVIRGTVVGVDGMPVADAFVSATRESDAAGGARTARSGWRWDSRPILSATDGTFRIDRLSPGAYTLLAQRRGGGESLVEHVAVGSTVRLQIKPTGSIEGMISSATDELPSEIRILVTEPTTGLRRLETLYRTGGRFAIRDLPAGRFTLEVSASGARGSISVTLAEGETKRGVQIALEPLITLTGRVVDFVTGTGVAGFAMSAAAATVGRAVVLGSTDADRAYVTDDQGRFTIRRAPSGRVLLVGSPSAVAGGRYDWIKTFRTGTGSGALEVGEIRVIAKRLGTGEPRGELGVRFREPAANESPYDFPLKVGSIDPKGPAAKSGLVVGDVVISIDGIDVTAGNRMHADALFAAPPGTKLAFGLARDATVTITLSPPT